MSDDASEADSHAGGDAAASQSVASGRAGDHADTSSADQSSRSGFSYSSDPVTGERLGGDLSERFNDESTISASATDAQGGAQGQADQSSGSADTGSSQSAAASAHDDLPDYAKETYRTDDDERFDDSHRSSHGFSHGM